MDSKAARPLVIALVFALVAPSLYACDQTPKPPPSAPERASEVAQAPQGVIDAPPRVKAATYELTLAPLEGADLAEQAFEISLAGVGDWHVNTDYPISVAVAADEGLEVDKANLDREDAAELSDDVARFVFVARSTGAPGERRVNAQVKFAMCTPSSCTFHDETLGRSLGSD